MVGRYIEWRKPEERVVTFAVTKRVGLVEMSVHEVEFCLS